MVIPAQENSSENNPIISVLKSDPEYREIIYRFENVNSQIISEQAINEN